MGSPKSQISHFPSAFLSTCASAFIFFTAILTSLPVVCVKSLPIIKDFGYDISIKKCKWYSKGVVKKVTGIILDKDNNPQVPNKLIKKVHNYILEEKAGNDSKYNNLQGCLVVSERINGKFGQYRKQLLKERKNKNN